MRMPDGVVMTLRALSMANLEDRCSFEIPGEETYRPGGVTEPGTPIPYTNVPCALVPLTADNDIVAERTSRAGKFVLVLPIGTPIGEASDNVVVTFRRGGSKIVEVDEVLARYTRDVNVKAYVSEVN